MKRNTMVAASFLLIGIFAQSCNDDGIDCCSVCTVGKACGDTCISEEYECLVPSGRACNEVLMYDE